MAVITYSHPYPRVPLFELEFFGFFVNLFAIGALA